MVKRTKGARGVGLFAALGGVAEAVAVIALGVTVGMLLPHLPPPLSQLRLRPRHLLEGMPGSAYPTSKTRGSRHRPRRIWIRR